eukprot:gene5830-23348_t
MALPVKRNKVLPTAGVPAAELVTLMRGFHAQDVPRWKDGKASGAVYHGGEEHMALQDEAFKLFNVSNPLHGDIWPSVTKFEAEVCGTLTSGGTESIIMAVKAHRQKGEQEKGITAPEIICADSAHAAIDKACDMLRIKLIKIP